ncbi:uncharacterized protein [Miscanthus floridulus]|uniref:uncharacterized protein n=1 Tax=Miscanthus floridulus TaxID=154761 RepID=UPI00345896D4
MDATRVMLSAALPVPFLLSIKLTTRTKQLSSSSISNSFSSFSRISTAAPSESSSAPNSSRMRSRSRETTATYPSTSRPHWSCRYRMNGSLASSGKGRSRSARWNGPMATARTACSASTGSRRAHGQKIVPVLSPRYHSMGVREMRSRSTARSAIRRAPLLVPLFNRCFLSCRPCLAGNPVFFVTDDRVLCVGLDILHFFTLDACFQPLDPRAVPTPVAPQQQHAGEAAATMPCTRRSLDEACGGKVPRWIEFWSDAASDRRHRDSSSSEASTTSSRSSGCASPPLAARRSRTPHWVDSYLDRLGHVLRQGRWRDTEVMEMVEVAASGGVFDGEEAAPAAVDSDMVLDALLLKADRCSDSLRWAGWSSEDVSDALGLDLRHCKERPRPAVRVPPEIAVKVEQLAQSVGGRP